MVLCKGSPEKCCPAHCFFLIPFFFGTICIIVLFFGLSSNFLKNIVFFPENSKNLLHAYEMVVPEVASLASVLRTCREQKICLWMGETGGRNEHAWQTTMYEILAEYHAGYNLWCWKTVEGAGEYASYTIREKETYTVSVTYCADKEVKVQAAIQGETLFEGVMPPAGEKVTSDVHPYFAYETAPNTLELFTLGTVTGEGILKIEVLDGCARFGQIVIRKSEK